MYQGDATGSADGDSGVCEDACPLPFCWPRSRARRSDQRTSVAPPRSGNGTSIVSKSRGGLGRGEHGARLVAQLPARVAAGDMGEREQPHLGVARELRGLPGGAVLRQACALDLLLGERGLVHEQVGLVGGERERLARRRVS